MMNVYFNVYLYAFLCIFMIHFPVKVKLTQHCKTAVLQFKKKITA